ncbi:hypothetical protein LTR96_003460 [Exophiala xenobiotica]|nr:hypothetical protein LTR72_001380 [Exophiala xenobiotica]KAK5234689.1 hypothetical protein LTR47_004132 [Exophiala xenobiotica]KAK5251680.1 hypothetical protein LTS06_003621 [Exophiala xenobiotica]KAK5271635.1 hypothetical protein LTR96_003460 [Exophiala xenobiotica]KAK5295815.1 hypothetical protein LTR14_003443 [Exophiala xenobiotica]
MPSARNYRVNVVVCGAGLGGLGVAICLAKKGHTVTVLESSRALNEVGAGIQIPPNSSRVLDAYGLTDKLLEAVTWPESIQLKRYANSEVIARTPLHPRNTQVYGHPYWLIHRADFQRILFDAAVEAGVEVRLGCHVELVDEQSPSVHLKGGEVVKADLIIGADGIKSKVRRAVIPDEEIEAVSSANCAYRATIPADVMLADPELAALLRDKNANCWIGYRRHLMVYPIRKGQLFNLVMSHPGQAPIASWSEVGDIEDLRLQYRHFDPVLRKLLSHVESCLKWKLAELEPLPTWVSASGRVVLLGDAAHATLPYLAAGAAMAVEDGAVLGECLDRCRDMEDLPRAAKAYEKLRKRRCELVTKGSHANGDIWHLPDGEDQEERDSIMGAQVVDDKTDAAAAAATATAAHAQKKNLNQWSDPAFQPWLWGYDAFAEANAYLDLEFQAVTVENFI